MHRFFIFKTLKIEPTLNTHRSGLGLPGSLIPFDPQAFAPKRQHCRRKPLSPAGYPPQFGQISLFSEKYSFLPPTSSLKVWKLISKLCLDCFN
jgi:hypothetical protein